MKRDLELAIADSQVVLYHICPSEKKEVGPEAWAGEVPLTALVLYQIIVTNKCFSFGYLLILKDVPISLSVEPPKPY